ncbi:hypothetical protein FOA52_014329 [Chlamydomonas sp. UWO 241]|nr:hypothetical protein FOA52_014329 [Chlamydomonas sp. UWO 241]
MAHLIIGTTRNLTPQFKRFRDEARRLRPEGSDTVTATLLNSTLGGSSSDVETQGTSILSPLWVQKSERVRLDLRILKDRLTKLKEAHARVLLVTFDGSHDAKDHAEALTRELQMGFKNLNQEISGIESIPGSDDGEVRREVKQQLARALMTLTMDFRKEETRFLSKVEAQKGLAAGSAMGLVDRAHGVDEDTDLLDPGFSQTQTAAVDSMTEFAIQRDREIVQIVETITELAQIMRDLGALVVEQGTILDRIDCNIADTEVKITEGVREIQSAEKKQKSTRMFMCIVALGVFIVMMILIIAIKVVM